MNPQLAIRSNPTLMKGIWMRTSNTRLTAVTASHPFSSSSSSSKNNKNKPNANSLPFRPRRRAPKPLLTPPPQKSTHIDHTPRHPPTPISAFENPSSEPNDNTKNHTPTILQYLRRAQSRLPSSNPNSTPSLASPTTTTTPRLTAPTIHPDAESLLRAADYFTSEIDSTEDRIFTRRALNVDAWSPEEGRRMLREVDALIAEERKNTWMNDDEGFEREKPPGFLDFPEVEAAARRERERFQSGMTDEDDDEMEIDDDYDPNQRAYGQWSESVVAVDRVQKVMRGGTTVRYRALAIGGNLNGCAGYGIAKAHSPPEAVAAACRKTRRNIFFVDRYKGHGLTGDLVGKHNSCRVTIRAVKVDRGLKGNPLGCEILKYFGITDCTVKSHGNRNTYNVVYAMFKALMCHESLEEIALKRGKRLLNVERAKRLQI